MWTRKELKENAKKRLQANYWLCVLSALILSIVIGASPTGIKNIKKADVDKFIDMPSIGTNLDVQDELDDAAEEIRSAADEIKEAVNDIDVDEDFDTSITINGQEVLGIKGSGLNKENKEAVNDTIDSIANSVVGALSSPEKIAERVAPIAASIVILVIFIAVIAALIGTAVGIFLKNPLEAGGRLFFLDNHTKKAQINTYSYAFKNNYLNIVKVLFLRDLFIVLWTLLFIVPGIIKAYEYKMIPYLLAEDSSLSTDEAFEKSKQMMMGHKWNAFVLDLSFIGWHLLSILTCGLLELFYVAPYMYQTDAELYFALKDGGNNNTSDASVYDAYVEVE